MARTKRARALRALSGLADDAGLKMAHEAIDRHAIGDRAGVAAARWLERQMAVREIGYRELAEVTALFANVLAGWGSDRASGC